MEQKKEDRAEARKKEAMKEETIKEEMLEEETKKEATKKEAMEESSQEQTEEAWERRAREFTALVTGSRSYRRFYEDIPMTGEQLAKLVNLGRLSSSGGNKQYLKYLTSCSPEKNEQIFDCLAWAGYLADWDGPVRGERPTGYIILLRDLELQKAQTVDEGVSAQSIFLGAAAMGFGGCMLMNIKRDCLMQLFSLEEERYAISMVIALGVPKEEVSVVPMPQDGSVRYYRDAEGRHYVPKRSMDEVLIREYK